jgi:hypothetical protein
MYSLRVALLLPVLTVLSACGTFFQGPLGTKPDGQVAATIGEIESGYTYIPVDPFPVETKLSSSCKEVKSDSTSVLLDSLPDNAVRMLVERIDQSGAITYGASKAGIKNESYRVTVDYINAPLLNFEWVFCGADRVKGGPRGMRPGAAHP